ncbi:hypothetical protein HH1059_17630 [Halorhodospira halochloris]|uniref:Uncharacterized protein n=1 Tax=Halorhodospira halochloris TaxID=1052 RepID=A0A2Z6EZM4_HALHR|nr:hypothetical protein [Halorhodospira halochloris]MBK1653072.1 hypothetical protein [Halorhodospira halochloris]BBE11120.1 hypothetical protein HH1059_17630 [Halorhodospira halochloris]
MTELLSPTNDYVFKRLFAEAPDLLVDLINDLRPDLLIPVIVTADSADRDRCHHRHHTGAYFLL